MATTNTCDLCGNAAIDTVEAKSKNTTPIKLDVCEEHLAEYKKLMRGFTGQELQEVQEVTFVYKGELTTVKKEGNNEETEKR